MGFNVSQHKRRKIFIEHRGRCYYCGQNIHAPKRHVANRDGREFTLDHREARANGGAKYGENLVPACYRCNVVKGDSSINEFRESLGYRMRGWPKFKRSHRRFLAEQGIELPSAGLRFYFETGAMIIFPGQRESGRADESTGLEPRKALREVKAIR